MAAGSVISIHECEAAEIGCVPGTSPDTLYCVDIGKVLSQEMLCAANEVLLCRFLGNYILGYS